MAMGESSDASRVGQPGQLQEAQTHERRWAQKKTAALAGDCASSIAAAAARSHSCPHVRWLPQAPGYLIMSLGEIKVSIPVGQAKMAPLKIADCPS